MAYAPPNTFSASTVLTAAALDGNQDALRVYLHEGINSADFQTAKWIETRHLQPPTFEPFTGTQHGISGHQAGQSVEATGIRLSFCTSYLTGNGLVGAEPLRWVRVPNTAISVQTRRAYRGLFHWTMELEHGPDNVPYTSGHTYVINDRPYTGAAGYGQRDGCVKLSGPVGTLTAGLCHYSQIDRVAVVNWSIALELYYV